MGPQHRYHKQSYGLFFGHGCTILGIYGAHLAKFLPAPAKKVPLCRSGHVPGTILQALQSSLQDGLWAEAKKKGQGSFRYGSKLTVKKKIGAWRSETCADLPYVLDLGLQDGHSVISGTQMSADIRVSAILSWHLVEDPW